MKARVTIDWLEPLPDGSAVPQEVFQFDQVQLTQHREIGREYDEDGNVTRLVPGETTTTLVGKTPAP